MALRAGRLYQFGPFRLDAEERLLFSDGRRVDLTPKALETLVLLVENHGHLVEKEDLIQRLWPETFVEESNLTFNVSVLRKALGDDRQNGNRFIETVPRRGYRFIAPIEMVGSVSEPPRQVARERDPAATRLKRPRRLRLALAGAAATAVLLLGYRLTRPLPPPRVVRVRQLTHDGREKDVWSAPVTDGLRVYFREVGEEGWTLAEVSTAGGEPLGFQTPWPAGALDISRDGNEMLLLGPAPGGSKHQLSELFALSIPGGPARRIGVLRADGASWSSNGRMIVYTQGDDLYVSNGDGAGSRKLLTAAASIWAPRWSLDGTLLRYTTHDASVNSFTLWEVKADGTGLQPLLPGWNFPPNESFGSWTPDGTYFVFQSTREAKTNIWAIQEARAFLRARGEPAQLTNDSRDYYTPVASRDGKTLFAIGQERRGELMHWDSRLKEFVDCLGGISAYWVNFSRDGRWVAYVKFPENTLWRAKADGSGATQLTFAPMDAGGGLSWSPDGKQIALRAQEPSKAYKIYLISTERAEAQELLPEHPQEEGIPTWSPDGRKIAFGDVPAVIGRGSGKEVIHICDVATRQLSALPGSEGLWTARWSPDGRYVAALKIPSQELMLYDSESQKWRFLGGYVNNPTWSRDGKSIYFDSPGAATDRGIFRARISDGKIGRVAEFGNLRRAAGWWSGLTPDDDPIILRDIGTQEIYALDINWP